MHNKPNRYKYLAILAIAALPALVSFGQLALVNPDFEDPTIYPWEAEGSGIVSLNTNMTDVFSGLQSAEVCFGSEDSDGIHQNILVDSPDLLQTYTVSFKVLCTGFTQLVGLRASLWENAPSGWVFNVGSYIWVQPGSNDWTTVSATLAMSSPTAQSFRAVMQVFPQGNPKVSGCVYVDDASITLIPPPPPTGDFTWAGGLADNAWDFTTANWLDTALGTPQVFTNGVSIVRFTDSGNNASPIKLSGTLEPGVVSVESSSDYSFSGSGKISGGAKISKTGTGVLTMANIGNDYTSNTVVTAGILQLKADEVIPDGPGKGSLQLSGTLDLNGHSETVNNLSGAGVVDNTTTNNCTFTINSVADSQYNGSINSSGGGLLTLVKTGPGMWQPFNNHNNFSGQAIINGGRVLLNEDTFGGSGSITISNNAYIMLWGTFGSGAIANDFYLYSVGGNVGGAVKDTIFEDSGSGTMQLTGTIHLMNTSDLGAYNTELLTVSGKVTGPGALWISSPGVLASEGAGGLTSRGKVALSNPLNDFTGGVVVYGGMLDIQADGAAGSGDVLVWTNATLELDSSGTLSSAARLSLSDASSAVNLNFSGTQNIHALSFNGGSALQMAGTWGAPGSGAVNTDARFVGTGILQVAVGPAAAPLIQPPVYDHTGTNLVLTVSSIAGHQYVLLYATNLLPTAVWLPVTTSSGTGGTLTNLVPVQKSLPEMFYRYLVE